MDKIVSLDVETTMSPNSDPFSQCSSLCRIGLVRHNKPALCMEGVYDEKIQTALDKMEMIVGFNLKFDIKWMQSVGYKFDKHKLWDCQYAYFLLHNQLVRYPSLDMALEEAGIEKKIDVVKTEYWDKGIDTPFIPLSILDEYLTGDVEKTLALFQYQYPLIVEAGLLPLMQLCMEDLKVLVEMESNGMRFNTEAALNMAKEVDDEVLVHTARLYDIFGSSCFNLASNDHLSAILYGGVVVEEVREVVGVYKSGIKVGQPRYKINRVEHTFPRRFVPIDKTETKKEGYWFVNVDVLKALKPIDKKDKEIIPILLEISRLVKLSNTYLRGWSSLIDEKNWRHNHIHQTLNQCVAVTGRLSSSSPNSQNADPITKKFIYSRYGKIGNILNFDVKGLEVVCAAFLSKDEVLRKELVDGVDIHSENQKAFGLPERVIAKVLKFRILYGGTEFGFVKDPDFTAVSKSKKYWKEVIDKYYEKYKGIKTWHDKLIEQSYHSGIVSPFGRKYVYSYKYGDCSAAVKNYIVQGFGADIVALIRVMFYERVRNITGVTVFNTVHDSIEVDCLAEKNEEVIEAMKNVLTNLRDEMYTRFSVEFDLDIQVEHDIRQTIEQGGE